MIKPFPLELVHKILLNSLNYLCTLDNLKIKYFWIYPLYLLFDITYKQMSIIKIKVIWHNLCYGPILDYKLKSDLFWSVINSNRGSDL